MCLSVIYVCVDDIESMLSRVNRYGDPSRDGSGRNKSDKRARRMISMLTQGHSLNKWILACSSSTVTDCQAYKRAVT